MAFKYCAYVSNNDLSRLSYAIPLIALVSTLQVGKTKNKPK